MGFKKLYTTTESNTDMLPPYRIYISLKTWNEALIKKTNIFMKKTDIVLKRLQI